jgi:molybdate/tungstate transport system permease protein
LLLVFGRRGLLGQWLAPLGLTFTDNLAGIIVAMLFVSLPFLVTMGRESFRLVDEELERVALIDGASQWQAFWLVTLPLAWRGVLGGAVMMWARGISEFGAVVILAYHPKIMPVLIYERFEGFGLDAALPAAVLLILAVLVVFGLLRLALLPETDKID